MVKRSEDDPTWRTASGSNGNGQCVEVAILRGTVLVRHSKRPDGPVLEYTWDEWRAFLQGAADGEFDLPTRQARGHAEDVLLFVSVEVPPPARAGGDLDRFLTDESRQLVDQFIAESADESDDFDINEALERNLDDAIRGMVEGTDGAS